jgi:NAD(P)-dependent dehydrogenase (short-subunit alcohol dehydrogenase family)
MSDATGRTALVTGANSGIGLATVIELAERGLHAVGSVRSAAKARRVHAAAREAGGAVEDVSDADARAQLEIMLVGPMRLARLAIPHMREAGGGRIVNVSSVYGLVTTPLSGWYQACKHGLEAVSDALRMEVARDGIRVVLIEPGGFDTGIWDNGAEAIERRAGTRYGTAYDRSLRGVELTRPIMGDPSAVARVIAGAIVSGRPKARYLVGYDARLARLYTRTVPEGVRDRLARVTLGL